ncbi:MAG: peptide chain release factor N(5)-glutamine methyltransferase [Thermoleophilia bacterium]|nr:peptide chain release factor N(5)-glutamine methyltransferase [Thermoleophilia bacterium]
MTLWTIGSLLVSATEYLRQKGSSNPRLDAELLLAHALGLERIDLYTQYDRPVSDAERDGFRALVARRAKHEPVAYILGRAHFRRLILDVSPAVLIPRPETEELVDLALETLRLRPLWEGLGEGPLVADVGTGSGAIALSLASEAGVKVLATEASAKALAVAARNRARLKLEALVELRQADLLEGVPDGSIRLVVSNPPGTADNHWRWADGRYSAAVHWRRCIR